MPPLLPTGDVIVHSGDLMPNRSFGIRSIEETWQPHWVAENLGRLAAWIGARPFLYTPGNHDYIDPTVALRAAGVDAHLLIGFAEVNGVGFYGHPWTPEFCGWNWMCGAVEMAERLAWFREMNDQGAIDVLVSHGPMYGVLDRNARGHRCGCPVLKKTLQEARHLPKAMLCGHLHEANGHVMWNGMHVSNAATTQRVVTV